MDEKGRKKSRISQLRKWQPKLADLIHLKENPKGNGRASLVPEVSCHAVYAPVHTAQTQQSQSLPTELETEREGGGRL